MAASRKGSPLATFLALAVLAFLGFVAGVMGSIVWEEPRLLIAYVMGDTTEIDWMGERPPLPGVASPPEILGIAEPKLQAAGDSLRSRSVEVPSTRLGPRLAIQVGAFESLKSAENLAQRLRSRDYAAYVVPGVREDHPRWRVRVGPLAHREAAASLANELKRNEHLPTWIMEEGSGPAR